MIGLPSLRALDRTQGTKIRLAVEPTDMRCGFDRLAERVRSVMGENWLPDRWKAAQKTRLAALQNQTPHP